MENKKVEAYFYEIINQAKNGITISDPNQEDNPVIYVNKAFEETFGYSAEETIGKNCRFLQGDDRNQINLQKIRDAIALQQSVTTILRNYTKEGKLIFNEIKVSPIFDKKTNKLQYFLGIQKDITKEMEQKKMMDDTIYDKIINKDLKNEDDYKEIIQELSVYHTELLAQNIELTQKDKNLELLNSELQSLFQDAPIAYILVDEKLQIKRYNKEANKHFAFSQNKIQVKSLFHFIKKENMERLIHWINEKKYLEEHLELDMICSGVGLQRFKIEAKPYVLDEESLLIGLMNIQTEYMIKNNLKKMVQEKTIEVINQHKFISNQAKLASMGEMIDAIAHQWLNPISTIKLHTQICRYNLQSEDNKVQESIEHLDKIEQRIDHLVETLNEFRAFFRPNENYEKVSIKSLIDSVLVLVKDDLISHCIEVEVDIQKDIEIKVIKNQFKHVFLNLINNSRDAFVENGVENSKIRLSCEVTQESIVIRYCDNAGGIPQNILDKVFEQNFTTKVEGKGTGIGLYLVKKILEKMDSKISVQNIPNGVCFFIELDTILIDEG